MGLWHSVFPVKHGGISSKKIMKEYKLRCSMFSFHVDPDLDILLEKLTAEIAA